MEEKWCIRGVFMGDKKRRMGKGLKGIQHKTTITPNAYLKNG
jgi:hypothetical protein